MDKEVNDYLVNMTNLLNGQLRGAINKKAKEDNKQLITLTLNDIFKRAYDLGWANQVQDEAFNNLKEELKDKDNEEH